MPGDGIETADQRLRTMNNIESLKRHRSDAGSLVSKSCTTELTTALSQGAEFYGSRNIGMRDLWNASINHRVLVYKVALTEKVEQQLQYVVNFPHA